MIDPVKAIELALANRTGDSFSGNLGFLSVEELAIEAEIPDRQAEAVLETLLKEGKVLTDGQGGFCGLPTVCEVCNETPCRCGPWRQPELN